MNAIFLFFFYVLPLKQKLKNMRIAGCCLSLFVWMRLLNVILFFVLFLFCVFLGTCVLCVYVCCFLLVCISHMFFSLFFFLLLLFCYMLCVAVCFFECFWYIFLHRKNTFVNSNGKNASKTSRCLCVNNFFLDFFVFILLLKVIKKTDNFFPFYIFILYKLIFLFWLLFYSGRRTRALSCLCNTLGFQTDTVPCL